MGLLECCLELEVDCVRIIRKLGVVLVSFEAEIERFIRSAGHFIHKLQSSKSYRYMLNASMVKFLLTKILSGSAFGNFPLAMIGDWRGDVVDYFSQDFLIYSQRHYLAAIAAAAAPVLAIVAPVPAIVAPVPAIVVAPVPAIVLGAPSAPPVEALAAADAAARWPADAAADARVAAGRAVLMADQAAADALAVSEEAAARVEAARAAVEVAMAAAAAAEARAEAAEANALAAEAELQAFEAETEALAAAAEAEAEAAEAEALAVEEAEYMPPTPPALSGYMMALIAAGTAGESGAGESGAVESGEGGTAGVFVDLTLTATPLPSPKRKAYSPPTVETLVKRARREEGCGGDGGGDGGGATGGALLDFSAVDFDAVEAGYVPQNPCGDTVSGTHIHTHTHTHTHTLLHPPSRRLSDAHPPPLAGLGQLRRGGPGGRLRTGGLAVPPGRAEIPPGLA